MPFGPIKAGEKRHAFIEIRGPRKGPEQKTFKKALQRLLKDNNARLTRRPRAGRG